MVSSAATRSLLNQSLSPGPVSHASKGRSPTTKKAKKGEVTIIPETPDTDVSLAKREKARRRSLAAMEKVLEEDFKRDQLELEKEEKQAKEGAGGNKGKLKGRRSMVMENISRIGSPVSSR